MSRPNGADSALARAKVVLAETQNKLAALALERNTALLRGTDADVAKVDAEVEATEKLLRTHSDRVKLLEVEAEKEEAARRAKEHAALIGRVEAKLAERDRAIAELAGCAAAADAALLKVFALNRAILAAWPWGNGDLGAVMLGDPAVLGALSNEIFRVAGRPPATGGMPGDPRGPSYPGGRPERLEWIMLPAKSARPLIEKFAEAAAAAVQIMRSGRVADAPPMNGAAHGTNGAAHPPANASPAEDASTIIGDVPQGDRAPAVSAPPPMPAPSIERTPAQVELAKLLNRRHVLAMSDDPKSEEAPKWRAYSRVELRRVRNDRHRDDP
jgi:hypothetical protein